MGVERDTRDELSHRDDEAPLPSSPTLIEKGPFQASRLDGLLEGMDPITGDFIRPVCKAGDEDKKRELPKQITRRKSDTEADRRRDELELDPSQLTHISVGGRSLESRKWSRLFISTLSNKSRSQIDEEDDESEGGDNCIFGHQVINSGDRLDTIKHGPSKTTNDLIELDESRGLGRIKDQRPKLGPTRAELPQSGKVTAQRCQNKTQKEENWLQWGRSKSRTAPKKRQLAPVRTKLGTERAQQTGTAPNTHETTPISLQIRFTIMIISTLCLSSILSNILTFNFTFICMAGERPTNFSADRYGEWEREEWEELGYNPDLDYNSFERSSLFMAVAVGALLAVFPLTVMLNRYGSRVVFGCLGYLSAISTLLMPLCAETGFPLMLLVRMIQGVGFSACLPVMGSITSHWSTLKQNGIFIAILSSFLQIAPIFTMPVSGVLCVSQLGWRSIYYLHGVVCAALFTLFMLYHRNSPIKHPLMQRREIVKVMFGKGSIYSGAGKQSRKASRKIPYAAFYHDKAIWAILVSAFGNFMGTQLSLQFAPTYINRVLHFEVEHTGLAAAISPVIMFFIKLLAGQSSDKITFIGDQTKLRAYNTLALGLMGTLFIVLAMMNPHEQRGQCLVVLIAATCILGFNSGGFFKSSQMVSRQHSHFTLANISFLNCVCMLIVPLMNELIAPDNEPKEWAIVLCIHGAILLATNAFFCVFCSSRPANWTLDSWRNKSGGGKVVPKEAKPKG